MQDFDEQFERIDEQFERINAKLDGLTKALDAFEQRIVEQMRDMQTEILRAFENGQE